MTILIPEKVDFRGKNIRREYFIKDEKGTYSFLKCLVKLAGKILKKKKSKIINQLYFS